MRVAAVSCLGSHPEDLGYLLEQVSAKAQDVRIAAYASLARMTHTDAVAAMKKALGGKDALHAAHAISEGNASAMLPLLTEEIRSGVSQLPTIKDKKQIDSHLQRLINFLHAFPQEINAGAESLLLELFAQRDTLAKYKGAIHSGADLIEAIVICLGKGSPHTMKVLVESHAEIDPSLMEFVFDAALDILPPKKVYDTFSPYLQTKVDEKKKNKDPAYQRREMIFSAIESSIPYYYVGLDNDRSKINPMTGRPWPEYDPRWLDLALDLDRLEVALVLARPDHARARDYFKNRFDAKLKKAKSPNDVTSELQALFRVRHPDVTEAFLQGLSKRSGNRYYALYWYVNLIPYLPKDAIPKLEEFAATLPDPEANQFLGGIQELRTK